jgi:hypothetical protein
VFDESTAKEHLYSANVLQSGLMPGYTSAASGLSFRARRYAFRQGRKFPKLLPIEEVSDDVLQHAAYFVALEVGSLDMTKQAFDPPLREDVWETVGKDASPLLRRLSPEDIHLLFRGRPPVVKRPADYREAPRIANLDERRILLEHKLIVRKILRPRK